MTTAQMVAALDKEIARLRQVRTLLSGAARSSDKLLPRIGRTRAGMAAEPAKDRPKRTLSAEARERIAAAQRARWAAHAAAKATASAGAANPVKRTKKRDAGSATA